MSFGNLVVVAAVAAVVPLLLATVPRVPVPAPVLEIVAGIVLGPAVLGVVRVDPTVAAASVLGLAFLLFLAGLEIDIAHFRGQRARESLAGLAVSVTLGLAAGYGLLAVGLVENPVLVGVALMATSLGLVVPLMKDAGVLTQPFGQLVIAGASTGEVVSVVLLSLLFSERSGPVAGRLLLFGLLALVAGLGTVAALRAERSVRVGALIAALADTTAQIRIRLAVLALVGLAAVAERLGFEAILGAFLAGGLLRLVDPDAAERHPQFRVKLEGIGFGFLIPVFFVVSGITFNVKVLLDAPVTLLRVPLFLALLLLVRGLPAIAYRRTLGPRQTLAAGLLQASSLPFIVAATQIGLVLHAVTPVNAAALVAAGLVSVLLFPPVALRLVRDLRDPPPAGPPADRLWDAM